VAPTLEAEAKRRWKAAGNGHGGGDSFEAYRLDAFIDLMGGSGGAGGEGGSDTRAGGASGGSGASGASGAEWSDGDEGCDDDDGDDGDGGRPGPTDGPGWGGGGGGRRPRPAAPRPLVIVNAESLRRGTTEGDEICEIEGIGPVSVAAAKELLSEGGLQFLVKEGFDIKTVTRSTRVIRQAIDMALIVRDRECARPGCGNRVGLERDHWRVDYRHDGPSALDNLVRLCPSCHALKTEGARALTARAQDVGGQPASLSASRRAALRAR
jgi:hypothetical protein